MDFYNNIMQAMNRFNPPNQPSTNAGSMPQPQGQAAPPLTPGDKYGDALLPDNLSGAMNLHDYFMKVAQGNEKKPESAGSYNGENVPQGPKGELHHTALMSKMIDLARDKSKETQIDLQHQADMAQREADQRQTAFDNLNNGHIMGMMAARQQPSQLLRPQAANGEPTALQSSLIGAQAKSLQNPFEMALHNMDAQSKAELQDNLLQHQVESARQLHAIDALAKMDETQTTSDSKVNAAAARMLNKKTQDDAALSKTNATANEKLMNTLEKTKSSIPGAWQGAAPEYADGFDDLYNRHMAANFPKGVPNPNPNNDFVDATKKRLNWEQNQISQELSDRYPTQKKEIDSTPASDYVEKRKVIAGISDTPDSSGISPRATFLNGYYQKLLNAYGNPTTARYVMNKLIDQKDIMKSTHEIRQTYSGGNI